MFTLQPLPYAYDALAPVISEQTLHVHHDKHHATYVKTLNELLEKAGKTPDSLEQVIRDAAKTGEAKLFNNAAQAWNHSFFWAAMSPEKQTPTGELHAAIGQAFGDLAGLRKAFVEEGAGHFGSGWVWLAAQDGGALAVRSTHDADDTVPRPGLTPLIVCDVWEHAYYLDHQNDRKGFLEAWFDALPNWSFAAGQLCAAKGQGEPWRHPPAA
ncbi:superoxide dismutase [Phenylobacterium sp.]|jgi:Fe-Mn family superoxide dismutase|uniref:superoxide dismutase n=1 Tax=Phenylobacterium sp. TaxID=1871053 RepID=UPI002F3EABBC